MEDSNDRVGELAPAAGCSPLARSGLVALAAPKPGEVVVGLGCGGCREAAVVVRRVAPGGRVIMVLTPGEALDGAPAGPPVPGALTPLVVRAEPAATGLRGGLADVVISSCPAGAGARRAELLRELHRLLRHGGRLVASERVALRPPPGGAAPRAQRLDVPSEAEFLELVRAAGFERLSLLQRTAPYEEQGRMVLSLTLEAFHR